MADPAVILSTLEAVAERHGDPGEAIYGRLFSTHPEFVRLFAMDTDGGVRGSMLQTSFECIVDLVGPRLTGANVISAERQHHQGYGVPDGMFEEFFVAMRDAFRDILAADWTPAMDREWRSLLDEIAAIA